MLVPTTMSEEPRETTLPDTVSAGAPGVRVLPATTIPLGLMVSVWPPMVIMLDGVGGRS